MQNRPDKIYFSLMKKKIQRYSFLATNYKGLRMEEATDTRLLSAALFPMALSEN